MAEKILRRAAEILGFDITETKFLAMIAKEQTAVCTSRGDFRQPCHV